MRACHLLLLSTLLVPVNLNIYADSISRADAYEWSSLEAKNARDQPASIGKPIERPQMRDLAFERNFYFPVAASLIRNGTAPGFGTNASDDSLLTPRTFSMNQVHTWMYHNYRTDDSVSPINSSPLMAVPEPSTLLMLGTVVLLVGVNLGIRVVLALLDRKNFSLD